MFHSKKVNILLGIWSFELNWKMAGTSHFVAHPHPECCCGFVFKNSELLLNKNGKIIGMPCFKCCSAKQEIYQHPSISWLQKLFLVIKCIPNIFFFFKSFTYSKIFRIFETWCVVKISTTFKRCLTGFAMQILICKTPRASS